MIKQSIMSNGISFISETVPFVNSVAIGIWIKVGSRHEPDHLQGITHFIEHILFKGTEKRTAKQIADELEYVGGTLNAFTSREYTCIYARVLKDDIALAIDLLSDMLLHSKFSPEDIEREKNVICEEILMYEDTPDEIIHDIFTQKVWQGHPLGRAILGEKDTVASFTQENVRDFYTKAFTPDRIVITAVGNINHDELEERLSNSFKGYSLSTMTGSVSKPIFIPTKYTKIKDTEQVHICIGAQGSSLASDQLYPFMVFNNLLGGGISSRLFQSIRENMGLAYSVYSYLASFSDEGLFVIYAGTNPKNAQIVMEEIFNQLRCLENRSISVNEFTRSQNQLRGSILLGMESVSHRMSRLGRSYISYQRFVTAEETIDKIMKVQLEDIYALGDVLLDFSQYSQVALGSQEIHYSV